MAARNVDHSQDGPPRVKLPAARSDEERENQLITYAQDLAEKQMLDGSVSAQVQTYYLKLGSSREKLEQYKIQKENELLEVKKDTMESAQRVEAMYAEAMDAFRSYAGQEPRVTD